MRLMSSSAEREGASPVLYEKLFLSRFELCYAALQGVVAVFVLFLSFQPLLSAEQNLLKQAEMKRNDLQMVVSHSDKARYQDAEINIQFPPQTPLLQRLEIEDVTRARVVIIRGTERGSESNEPNAGSASEVKLKYNVKDLFVGANHPKDGESLEFVVRAIASARMSETQPFKIQIQLDSSPHPAYK
jgi:hypothetical protein